jgi:lysozyme
MRRSSFGPWFALCLLGCGAPPDTTASSAQAASEAALEPSVVCGGKTILKGIDVSHYDGNIDWATVASSGVVFAFAKVSEGTAYKDQTFAGHWAAMKRAGVVRGAYHFYHPSDDPTNQVDYMLSLIDDAGGLEASDLPPALDVETTDSDNLDDIAAGLRTAVKEIKSRTGRKPIVYSSVRVWETMMGDPTVEATLWVVDYHDASCPDLPDAFGSWAFWQYGDAGHVPGIAGAVDMNRFNGSKTKLHAL